VGHRPPRHAPVHLIGLGGSLLLTLGSLVGFEQTVPLTGLSFTLKYIGHGVAGFQVTYASQLLKTIFLSAASLRRWHRAPAQGPRRGGLRRVLQPAAVAVLGMMVVASAQELLTLLLASR